MRPLTSAGGLIADHASRARQSPRRRTRAARDARPPRSPAPARTTLPALRHRPRAGLSAPVLRRRIRRVSRRPRRLSAAAPATDPRGARTVKQRPPQRGVIAAHVSPDPAADTFHARYCPPKIRPPVGGGQRTALAGARARPRDASASAY